MAKVFITLITYIGLLFVISCKSTSDPTIRQYGYYNENDNNVIVSIDLEQYDSFDTLYRRIESIACNDSLSEIIIHNGNTEIKQIRLFNPCWKTDIICIRKRNVLRIIDDEIHVDTIFSLDRLESTMTKHYNNYGKSPYYSEQPNKALISISYENKEMDNLSNLLNRITACFDPIRNDNPLVIEINGYFPPPPPPPPIIEPQ